VQSRFLILEAHNEKFEAFKLNQESTKRADEAREVARLSTRVALAAVRKCRAQEGAPEPTEAERAEASRLGREAYALRKQSKDAAAEAAMARRIACFQALPPKPVPEIPCSALPLKPPSRKIEA
jgi:hypothetical protein